LISENRFQFSKATSLPELIPKTGLYQFKDLNGDGSITSPEDLIGLKSVTQSIMEVSGRTLNYGNFQLDLFFPKFVKQTGYNYLRSFAAPGGMSNQPQAVMQHWQQAGDVSPVQRFTYFDPDATVTHGLWKFDTVRLRNF